MLACYQGGRVSPVNLVIDAELMVSDLLSLITAQPILQGGDAQAVWTRDEVHSAGLQFLEWMHEIRHRGTFSKVALAFAQLVDAVKTTETLRGLADQWLEVSDLPSISVG